MVAYGRWQHQYSLRTLAGDWHGGQWSALYAFASTGTAVRGLAAEIAECIAWCEQHADTAEAADLDRLRQFYRFITHHHPHDLEEHHLEEHHLEEHHLEEHDTHDLEEQP